MLAAPANGHEPVVLSDINALHHHRYAEHLRLKRQSKVIFEHCVESARLLRFVVRVHGRFVDKFIKPFLTQALPPFVLREFLLALPGHTRLL